MEGKLKEVLIDLENEIYKARTKFPENEDLYYALGEEFGELGEALIQHKHDNVKGKTDGDIYKEAIQTACVAIRIATEGDKHFPYDPPTGYKEFDR